MKGSRSQYKLEHRHLLLGPQSTPMWANASGFCRRHTSRTGGCLGMLLLTQGARPPGYDRGNLCVLLWFSPNPALVPRQLAAQRNSKAQRL